MAGRADADELRHQASRCDVDVKRMRRWWRVCLDDSPSSRRPRNDADLAIARKLLSRAVAYAHDNHIPGFVPFKAVELLGRAAGALKPYDVAGDLVDAGALTQIPRGFEIQEYRTRLSTLLRRREQGNARQRKWRKSNAERRRNAARNALCNAPTAPSLVSSASAKRKEETVGVEGASPAASPGALPVGEPQAFRGDGAARKPPRKPPAPVDSRRRSARATKGAGGLASS